MANNYDIFISYRRDGGFETAKHLNDLLVHDGYTVSFDIDTLREGDFDETLLKRIDQCVDFILVVDKHTFDRTLDSNFDPKKDWLRTELAHALKLKKNIVPILLSGVAGFPDNLPEDIADVSTKNGPEYNKYYFDEFYKRLKSFLHCVPRNAKKTDTFEKRVNLIKKFAFGFVLMALLLLGVMVSIPVSGPNEIILTIQSETELSEELIRQQMVYVLPELVKASNEKLGNILSNFSIETDDRIDRLAPTGISDIVFSSQMNQIIGKIRSLIGKRDLIVSVKLLETDSICAGRFDIHDWHGHYSSKTIEETKNAYDNKKKCAISVVKKGTAFIVSAYSPVTSALFDYENSDVIDEYIDKSPWKETLYSHSNRIEMLQQAIADESPDCAYCLLVMGDFFEHEGKSQSTTHPIQQACDYYDAFAKLYPDYATNIQERIKVLEQFTSLSEGVVSLPDVLIKQGIILDDSPCKQLIIVSNQSIKSIKGRDYYKADLSTYEKLGDLWKQGPVACEVNLGIKGIASQKEKKEGDKMTPSGYYPLPFAFGLKKDVDTKMEFRELNRNHVWVSDTLSKDYNLWIEDQGGVYRGNPHCERLLSIMPQYKYAIVIDFNSNPIVKGKGSAIFIHVQPETNRATAGCISIPETEIVKLVQWLDPSLAPHIYVSKTIESR